MKGYGGPSPRLNQVFLILKLVLGQILVRKNRIGFHGGNI